MVNRVFIVKQFQLLASTFGNYYELSFILHINDLSNKIMDNGYFNTHYNIPYLNLLGFSIRHLINNLCMNP